ncbi:hypothetical protein WU87_03255 [Corynebacterium minutissimum]|uniref:Uncharacterized protein n=1 Tax=Corynebacterium minutissimum TaxID=38301 RepID=A0ACC4UCL8_9CORY|nr:hypothetical protein WU87_03255 [Corynebacterium minutissimum]
MTHTNVTKGVTKGVTARPGSNPIRSDQLTLIPKNPKKVAPGSTIFGRSFRGRLASRRRAEPGRKL